MSQENVEVIRAFFEAWNAGDMDAVREMHDPDVSLRTVENWPESGPYVGREAVMRFYERIRDAWDADAAEPITDFIDATDRVVVRCGEGPFCTENPCEVAISKENCSDATTPPSPSVPVPRYLLPPNDCDAERRKLVPCSRWPTPCVSSRLAGRRSEPRVVTGSVASHLAFRSPSGNSQQVTTG